MVGIGVGVGIWETRCGGGGWGAWQEAAPPSGCRASRDWRCVCVCVCVCVWCLLELIAKAISHDASSLR